MIEHELLARFRHYKRLALRSNISQIATENELKTILGHMASLDLTGQKYKPVKAWRDPFGKLNIKYNNGQSWEIDGRRQAWSINEEPTDPQENRPGIFSRDPQEGEQDYPEPAKIKTFPL